MEMTNSQSAVRGVESGFSVVLVERVLAVARSLDPTSPLTSRAGRPWPL